MDRIEIYWGADKDFEEATEKLEDVHFLVDVVNHINKTDLKIEGRESSGSHGRLWRRERVGASWLF